MKITPQAADAFARAWDETRDGTRENGWNRLQQVIDDYTDSVRAAKETAMDERTPKAKQLVAMMKATMNLDLDELIQAGVIDDRDGQESSPWAKWNKDAPLFIAKLDDRQLNSLAALIAHKFPDAFARALKPEPFDSAGLRGAVAQTRETHASLYGPASPDYLALLETAVEENAALKDENKRLRAALADCPIGQEEHQEILDALQSHNSGE